MKIHGHPASTCTRKVLTTLAEKNHPYEFVLVDFAKGEHKAPAHTRFQPFGQVPALEEDDGWVLYESRAICRYLDATLPGPKLTPSDARAAARMEQWMSVETSNFTPHAMKIVYQTVFARWYGKDPIQANIDEGREKLQLPLDVLERQLAQTEWLVGDQYTLADLCYLPYLEYLEQGGDSALVHSRPNVSRWWTAARARPSWRKTIGK